MSETGFYLSSSTRAIAGSENAVNLIRQKERVEQAMASGDPALVLDTSKAFLESIFKTILSDRIENPDLDKKMSPLFVDVRNALSLNRDENARGLIRNISGAIVHNVAELRNKFGAASHGDDGYFDNPIGITEAEFVAQVVDGLAGFLLIR